MLSTRSNAEASREFEAQPTIVRPPLQARVVEVGGGDLPGPLFGGGVGRKRRGGTVTEVYQNFGAVVLGDNFIHS